MSTISPQNKKEENSGWNHLNEVPAGNWKPEKRDRDRSWEKENKAYTFRGIDPDTHDRVLALAQEWMVSASDIAQVLIEYALALLEREELQIESYLEPKARRMKISWQETSWCQTPPKKKKKQEKDPEDAAWKFRVSYRLQNNLVERIRGIADKHNVSQGDVITLFFICGFDAYEKGRLTLNTEPVTVKMTLTSSLP